MNEALLKVFQQAYQDFNLLPLIEPEDIERFRVDYGREPLVRLKQEVNASAKAQKFVFTGHTGCGKSTLLKRFTVEMKPQHFTVFFSIADMIEPADITHRKILYAIAVQLLHAATEKQIAIDDDIKENLLGWLDTTHKQKKEKSTKSEFGLGISNLLKFVTLKFQQEQAAREEFERVFEKRVVDLVKYADRIAAAIQIATKKPVLVVIDDLDKLDLPLVESIYRNNIKVLFSPQFRIVFTIPISATQDPQVMGALTSEGIVRPALFPVSKFFAKSDCHKPEAAPIDKTVNIFLEVLKKRIPAACIDPGTAHQMVLKSGGVMRELVRLGRECCTECMVQLELEPDRADLTINDEILNVAVRNLRNDFARQIGTSLFPVLKQVYQTLNNKDTDSDAFVKLLHGLMVLEYQNDDLWYDVHPIVVDLLQRQGLLE
ncbi:ABC transporter ATP-binding protein [Stenomitos frigidus]|uniref:KAP family P-loop domain protein n=1 Tax=Stenomitos frigidus ULC18 TaxID=2107698 RepID=A0A2T1E563_9CYAN|nr:ABC transporter ATP-binding protein [Stenomitos frigidus]PSB27794.1 KAP family P-loop domain protein [Stenomitos frigidus ULC18]